jgi:hypothetical protein
MLWNLFRHLPDTIAYYEPLHDFLPHHVNYPINASPEHLHVKTYFDEYNQIKEVLDLHKIEFARKNLYLESNDHYDDLKIYLEKIINLSKNFSNIVLKFNRIDLRLPWIKKNFPNAKILHIFRDPRDQWYSSLKNTKFHEAKLDFNNFSELQWAWSLYKDFPFLSDIYLSHPYERSYYLWKLSYLIGSLNSDYSFSYKELLNNPNEYFLKIKNYSNFDGNFNSGLLRSLIEPNPKRSWEKNISDNWFMEYENKCEELLEEVGINKCFGRINLIEIQNKFSKYKSMVNNKVIHDWFVNSLISKKNFDDFNYQKHLMQSENNFLLKINELKQEIREINYDYELIVNSKSWKITKPLREFVLKIKGTK